ncbi:MAG: hypothetical protein WBG05_03635 [Thermoanaerobaculia bacterium]
MRRRIPGSVEKWSVVVGGIWLILVGLSLTIGESDILWPTITTILLAIVTLGFLGIAKASGYRLSEGDAIDGLRLFLAALLLGLVLSLLLLAAYSSWLENPAKRDGISLGPHSPDDNGEKHYSFTTNLDATRPETRLLAVVPVALYGYDATRKLDDIALFGRTRR